MRAYARARARMCLRASEGNRNEIQYLHRLQINTSEFSDLNDNMEMSHKWTAASFLPPKGVLTYIGSFYILIVIRRLQAT